VDKTTAQQSKVWQFETDKNLDLENFLLKFLDHIIHHELPKLKSSSQQDLMDKTTAPKPRLQPFESTGVPGSAAAAETSGSYYYSSDGKWELK
jgi:hypothetical protein